MTKRLRAVVLDLYGTAVHITRPTNPFKRLFGDLGLSDPEQLQYARQVALTENFPDLASFVSRIAREPALDLAPYAADIINECNSVEVYPEIRSVLSKIRAAGLQLGVISNLAFPYKKPFLDLGISDLFDETIFSFEVGLMKPDPRIYRLMLERLQIASSEVIMVGDKLENDVRVPISIGMEGILLYRQPGICPEGAITNLSELPFKLRSTFLPII